MKTVFELRLGTSSEQQEMHFFKKPPFKVTLLQTLDGSEINIQLNISYESLNYGRNF